MLGRIRGFHFVALLALAACGADQKWQAPNVGVPPEILAREISPELVRPVLPEDIPEIPPPRHLRSCCAFGTGLHLSLMSVPVPALELPNVLGVEDLGPHRYDNGALAFEASRPGGTRFTYEHNGLVYTCRGGFMDTAHVRDWADWTLFLASRLGRSLEAGLDMQLAPEGGLRRVKVVPVDAEEIERYDRRDVVVPLAQWIAFQLSVWHEIATWYGWSAVPLFPEEASAFSLEDLYSNLLGIKLAGSLIYQGAVVSEASYNENMNGGMRVILERMGAQPAEIGRRAAHAVDGQWWDSRVALPAKRLVLRRNFETGISINPWLVQQAPVSNEDKAAITALCGEPEPIALRNPDTCVTGRAFADYAEIEIEVDPALAERGFPFPRPDSRMINQRDFASVINHIRAQNAAEFGASADRPD